MATRWAVLTNCVVSLVMVLMFVSGAAPRDSWYILGKGNDPMEIQSFNSYAIRSASLGSDTVDSVVGGSSTSVPVAGDQVSLGGSQPQNDSVRNVRIVHINDLHGAVEDEAGSGGLAKAATVIKRERAEAPGSTLTLNAGDLAEGSMVSYLTKGRVVTEALGEIGFDAVEPGNHDFAWGQAALQEMLSDINAPVLGANITNDDGSSWSTPYLMKEVNGVKVGMIGVDVQDMKRYIASEKLEGLKFEAASEAVAKYLPAVKAEGADIIMVVSHVGFEDDKKLAQQFPEIDVIVGGHSHTELPGGHYEGNTLIVQTGTKGKFVGEVDLQYDTAARRIIASEATLIPVDETIAPDPEVSAIIEAAAAKVADVGAKVMGVAEEDLHYSHSAAAKINQIHADSVLQATNAEIALVSARNPRGNIEKGEVTYEKLFSAFPHTEEDTVVMKVPGRLLVAEMEERIADGGRGAATPAGFTYTYDTSLPDGSRITDITMADGSKFDPDKEYTVGTTISMARKKTFKDVEYKKTVGSSQEMFMEYFSAGSPWRDDPDSRVVAK